MSNHTPTTELEAVNEMLAAISESPVESLTEGNADVQVALGFLRNNNRLIQSRGWAFNTETAEIEPIADPDGSSQTFLILPNNTLRARLTRDYQHLNYVYRKEGSYARFYDRKNRTFNIDETVEAELILALDFEALPQSARDHITAVAGYQFVATQMGAEPNIVFTRDRIAETMSYMAGEEMDAGHHNVLHDSPDSSLMFQRFI